MFCVPPSRISIGHDPIKASSSRFRKGKFLAFQQISMVLETSRFRFWVGSLTMTKEWRERFTNEKERSEESTLQASPCLCSA